MIDEHRGPKGTQNGWLSLHAEHQNPLGNRSSWVFVLRQRLLFIESKKHRSLGGSARCRSHSFCPKSELTRQRTSKIILNWRVVKKPAPIVSYEQLLGAELQKREAGLTEIRFELSDN